ncbi:DNA repair protein [Clostridium sp. AWRP]|uniref:DNA repair protein n=1 Tax=Clostridium sp. AWRP TaxID=2212991 RepID=UPI000FD7BC4B|nr:DNA repair protein [Clostridium sp. AWRP]AZV58851.1 DNA repair protein [Clostridium sp. AWRP]
MKLEISKITIKGFKGYLKEVEFPLGYRTEITGDNGLGKSSIGDAIVWCMTGCDISGNEKATTKLVNDKKPKLTEVVLEFELDGQAQTLIRRKKGSSTEIYWNEDKITNNDLTKDLYKNKDIFLSIFNPYYFPELAPKNAKSLLSSILKPIDKEEIFQELGDFLKEKLVKNKFKVPETFLSDKRAELKEQEENIIFCEGVVEGSKPIEIPGKKVFDDKELNSLKSKIETIKILPEDPKIKDFEKERQNLEVELSLGFQGTQQTTDISIMKAQKDSLLKQYKDIKVKIDNLGKNIVKCGKCGNEIDINETIRKSLSNNLQEVLQEGKSKKAEIDKISSENQKITEKNSQASAKWKSLIGKQLEVIDKKIEELRNKTNEINKENEEKLQVMRNRLSELKEEETQVLIHNANIDSLLKQNEKIEYEVEQSKKEIENSKLKIAELKVVIDAGKQYNSIKLKKQSEMIGKYLDKVKLQFEKLNKDGELKDDFKILYEGREFNKLSNAEKIKAGLEMSNFIANMLDLHFPVFVDNAESITQIQELNTQMLIARVVENKKLEVEVLK